MYKLKDEDYNNYKNWPDWKVNNFINGIIDKIVEQYEDDILAEGEDDEDLYNQMHKEAVNEALDWFPEKKKTIIALVNRRLSRAISNARKSLINIYNYGEELEFEDSKFNMIGKDTKHGTVIDYTEDSIIVRDSQGCIKEIKDYIPKEYYTVTAYDKDADVYEDIMFPETLKQAKEKAEYFSISKNIELLNKKYNRDFDWIEVQNEKGNQLYVYQDGALKKWVKDSIKDSFDDIQITQSFWSVDEWDTIIDYLNKYISDYEYDGDNIIAHCDNETEWYDLHTFLNKLGN